VVVVFPGAVVLFPCEAPVAGVVFVCPGAVVLFPCEAPAVDVVFGCPGAVALFPCEAPAVDVVFVCPGAVALFPCEAPAAGVVFVCPGAVALFPCEAPAAGVVFFCPGATVLRPCAGAVLVFPGAVALFPCKVPAAGVVFCAREPTCDAPSAAFAVLAANTSADNAGRRSDAEGFRGSGCLASGGGPCEGRRAWVSGIPATGIKPSPPSTIATSQPRKSTNATRPARPNHRARLPVGSSRTADPPPPTVVPTLVTAERSFVAETDGVGPKRRLRASAGTEGYEGSESRPLTTIPSI
jgi:hypothetical protein